MAEGNPQITVCVPTYNEVRALPELHRRLSSVLDPIDPGWELVIADDGSDDGTRELIRQMTAEFPRVRGVLLSRNFGHTPAYLAALAHGAGEWTVLMDADLQDRPEEIPRLLERAREGFDVVYAIKEKRPEGRLMRLAFWSYYRLAGRVSDVPQPADAGPFCVMSRRVVGEVMRLSERSVFLPGVRAFVGFKQSGIEVERDERQGGRSRIPLRRRVAGALDGILAFSKAPLRIASWVGIVVAFLAAISEFFFIYFRLFTDVPVEGLTTVITLLLFLGGVQLLTLGIIGEYLGRVYDEVKGRPRYVVDEWLNLPRLDDPARDVAEVEPRAQGARVESGS